MRKIAALAALFLGCLWITAGQSNVSAPTPALLLPSTLTNAAVSASAKATVTASVNVKATPGNVYGLYALNGAASTCWVEFINSAGAGALGTGVIFSVPLPASTTTPIWVPLQYPVNFSTGIAVGIATTNGGATVCGTGGNLTVFFQ